MANITFRPGLAQSLAVVVVLPLLCGLGIWQLQRAQEKAQLFAAINAAQHATAQPVKKLHASFLPQHAYATGHYDHRLFLLDNRVQEGRAGYELLAVLYLADGHGVLVDLGWRPQGRDRAHLPSVTLPRASATVEGIVLSPSPPPFTLSSDENLTDGWPKVVQNAQPAQLAAALGAPLLPFILYPDGSAAAQHELAALHYFPPARHRAYALQWFAMAVVVLFLYLRHGVRRGAP